MEHLRFDFQRDNFLRYFTDEFSGVLTYEQAGEKEGPHVYLIVNGKGFPYPSGASHVKYIGYTDNPSSRFSRHQKLREFDRLMMLELRPYLLKLKQSIPNWSRLGDERRDIAMEMERVFIYLFKDFCGAIPDGNIQEPVPDHKTLMLAQYVIHLVKNRDRMKGFRAELEDITARMRAFEQHGGGLGHQEVPVENRVPELEFSNEQPKTPDFRQRHAGFHSDPDRGSRAKSAREADEVTQTNTQERTGRKVKAMVKRLWSAELTCEEAIIRWFLENTKRREKVDIREMYDFLADQGFKRSTIRSTRCNLTSCGVLCHDGGLDSRYRLSDPFFR